MLDAETPDCLKIAYKFLLEDRAWVFCMPVEGGVATLASHHKVGEVLRSSGGIFAVSSCPKEERISFLLGGLSVLRDSFAETQG